MSSPQLTSPVLLDSLALSSSSSSSTSSFSFFGRDDNGVDSQTDPESPCSSPTSSAKDSRWNGFRGGLQEVVESPRMGAASPSSQATPKASYQFLKKCVDEDVGYDSGREDTKRGELVTKVKKKKLRRLLFQQQSSFARSPSSKAPIGLGLDSLPPRNQSTIVSATPSKPVLRAVDSLGSPSPIMSLPSPLFSATCVTSKPHEANISPLNAVSPRMLCSPLLMSLLR